MGKDWMRRNWRRLLVIPPLLIAVAVIVIAVQGRSGPQRVAEAETVHPARVVDAVRLDVVPRASGFGPVVPGRTWEAVAEVAGRVEYTHPDLKNGAMVAADTLLIRIESGPAELALAQVEAQIRELDIRQANTRRSLEIERRSLESLRRDLDRQQTLRERGAAPQAAVDGAERALLQGEQQVQTLDNTLSVLPQERAVLEARRDDAARDVDRTEIRAPFDLRVRSVTVEADQYAARGQTLAAGDGVAVAEVTAQVAVERLWVLVAGTENGAGSSGLLPLRSLPDIRPVVRLRSGDMQVEWPARLARIAETFDPQTRTVGVIVAVDDPYADAVPGLRPPLARGMFVEVDLFGPPRPGSVVIPREAVRSRNGGTNGREVWVLDDDNRMRRQAVRVAFVQGGAAVIAEGLEAGARVVLSDLIPASEGMRIEPTPDDAALARLRADVTPDGAATVVGAGQ